MIKLLQKKINGFIGIVLFIVICNNLNSQTFSKFGIKSGVVFSGLESQGDQNIVKDKSAYFNFLSLDVGVFSELFNSRLFCLSTEIHYQIRGEQNTIHLLMPTGNFGGEFYEYRNLNDRFHYLSFQLLPRIKALTTIMYGGIYFFGGPRLDLRLSNSSSDGKAAADIKNFKPEIGMTLGFGGEPLNFLSFEFRYEHNFSKIYSLSYLGKTLSRNYNGMIFLVGFSLDKLFKSRTKAIK